MTQALRPEAVKAALANFGWTQGELADRIGVSAQTVSNWVRGSDFPRPAALLKLATTLKLQFDELVAPPADLPVVAFRRKGGARTTASHIAKARQIGQMLQPLVPKLSPFRTLRTLIPQASCSYAAVQASAAETRQELKLGADDVLSYEHLIGQFRKNGAVLVPVLWGERKRHENALHIRLPREDITFVYLNLDTRVEDFKFWMAHELAHVYTPDLAGEDAGEDFADEFAGALLCPEPVAKAAYERCAGRDANGVIATLMTHASRHQVSLFTVFCQVRRYWEFNSFPSLRVGEDAIHKVRNSAPSKTVAATIWGQAAPNADAYVTTAGSEFQSEFFAALAALIRDSNVGPGYVQQVLDIPLADANSIYKALKS